MFFFILDVSLPVVGNIFWNDTAPNPLIELMECMLFFLFFFILCLNSDISTGEIAVADISRSKSCDGKIDDTTEVISTTVLPVTTATTTTITTTTAVNQLTTMSNQEAAETVSQPIILEFHENHGRNVQLSEGRKTAKRTASYNQGVIISNKPLPDRKSVV